MKSQRKQFKHICKTQFNNGCKNHQGGYCTYFKVRDGEVVTLWATSGILDPNIKWIMPHKQYDNWKQIYKDGKLYFAK